MKGCRILAFFQKQTKVLWVHKMGRYSQSIPTQGMPLITTRQIKAPAMRIVFVYATVRFIAKERLHSIIHVRLRMTRLVKGEIVPVFLPTLPSLFSVDI